MQTRCRSVAAGLAVTLALAASAAAKPPLGVPAPPLPLSTPESQGMSSERLARLHAGIERFVAEGRHAGAISLVARNGRIVDWHTYGKRDLEAALPMEKDTNLDPREKTVALLFVQHLPYDEHKIFWRFSTLVYAAIAD